MDSSDTVHQAEAFISFLYVPHLRQDVSGQKIFGTSLTGRYSVSRYVTVWPQRAEPGKGEGNVYDTGM